MLTYCIVILSILIQIATAIQALRLIRITGKQLSWTLIAVAMALQASRRIFTLIDIINGNITTAQIAAPEWIGLAVSVLMLPGVASFGSFLHKSKASFKERKLAEEALKAQQDLFQKTFDFSPLPSILLKLPEYIVVRVNPAFEKLFGYTRDEITGKPVDEFDLWADPMDRLYIKDAIDKEGKLNDHEFVFKTKSGETGDGIYYSETIDHLSTTFVLTKVMDVTHYVQTQEALQESESKFRKLYEEGPFGMAYINKEFMYMTANQTYIDMFGYSLEELQHMTFKDITHPEDVNIDLPFIQQLINKEIPVYKIEKRYLKKDGQVMWGSLTVTSNYNKEGNFLYNLAIVEDISDRKAYFEMVLKNEERYRELIDQASDGIFVTDETGRYVDVNKAGCELLGYTIDEIKQKYLKEIIYLTNDTPLRMDEIRKGKSLISERNLIRKDGSHVSVEISAKQLSNGYIQGIVRDITERKMAEKELKASEERFRYTLENMLEGVQIIGFDWKYIYMNRQAEIQNRLPNVELLGKTYMEIWPGIEKTEVFRSIEKVLRERIPCQMENEFVYPNGKVGWFDLSIQPVPEGVFILSIDVTERRLAEESLRASEHEFRSLAESMPQIVWITNVNGENIYFNQQWVEYTGLSLEESYGTNWIKPFHPDDKQFSWDAWQNAVENSGIYSIEVRLRRFDGVYRWWLIRGVPLLNDKGEILKWFGTCTDIEEIKMSGVTITQSEEKFRNFFENSVVGKSMTTLDGKLQINKAYEDILGYSQEELNTLSWQEITHPEDVARDLEIMNSIISGEYTSRRWEKRYIHKDGHYVWVDVSTFLQRDSEQKPHYFITSILEITDRKKAEETLRESRAKLEAALSSMTDAVFISNNAGEFIEFNDAFATFHKFGNKNECARTLSEYPDFLEVYMENGDEAPMDMWAVPRALRGETATNAEYILRRKDTGETWVGSYSFSPIRDKDDKIVGSVVVGRDITERKRGEEEIRKLNSELEQRVIDRTSQLANANKELEAFSYSVSHDLRAPLRGIDGFSLALFEDYYNELDDTAKNYIERIRNATKRMDGLIDSLLTLARISRLDMNMEKVNLSDIVRGIANGLTEGDKSRKAQFIIPENITTMGDPGLLKIVMENLLNNAWKFTSKKENTIIEFGTFREKSKTTYYIKDNGVGFDMQYANKLFSAFQRLHSDKEYPGTGVGLTTVQRIIRRHNGDIHAESILNKGTTFYFTL